MRRLQDVRVLPSFRDSSDENCAVSVANRDRPKIAEFLQGCRIPVLQENTVRLLLAITAELQTLRLMPQGGWSRSVFQPMHSKILKSSCYGGSGTFQNVTSNGRHVLQAAS